MIIEAFFWQRIEVGAPEIGPEVAIESRANF